MTLHTFDSRLCLPELMDRPDIDPAAHREALADLARINRLSFSAAHLWRFLRPLAQSRRDRPLRVLDVATGGGDVPIQLSHKAKQAGLACSWHACDISSTALDVAKDRAERLGAEIEFFPHDILTSPLPDRYDVVMCSLFMHHLADEEAVRVLSHMAAAATARVLVNDLERSATGYALAWIGTRMLSDSDVVHYDGPVSVRAAFRPHEARRVAAEAGLSRITVSRCWPFRFLLAGTPS